MGSTTTYWYRDVGGKKYHVSAVSVTGSSTMTWNTGFAQTAIMRVIRYYHQPLMPKENKIIQGYMFMEGEILEILRITLGSGKVQFKASCIAKLPHTGDMIGMVITDIDQTVVWEHDEHITPCPSAIYVGDTLEMDFELDPMGHGRIERWVRVK